MSARTPGYLTQREFLRKYPGLVPASSINETRQMAPPVNMNKIRETLRNGITHRQTRRHHWPTQRVFDMCDFLTARLNCTSSRLTKTGPLIYTMDFAERPRIFVEISALESYVGIYGTCTADAGARYIAEGGAFFSLKGGWFEARVDSEADIAHAQEEVFALFEKHASI
jgi:hypothetical protein